MKKALAILLSIFLIIGISNYSYSNEIDEDTDYIWLYEEIKDTSAKQSNELKLNSRYICVLDRTSKRVLFSKNENTKAPMASTTKIMTAIVLMENIENAGLELTSTVEVSKNSASVVGSRLGLKTGDKITVNDLLYGLMLCSRK